MNDLKQQIITGFQANEALLNGKASAPIFQTRKKALACFQELGFPTPKHEEWKYSNVKNITQKNYNFQAGSTFAKTDLETINLPNLTGNVLYFLNGAYRADLSTIKSDNETLQVMSIADACEKQPALVEKYFAKYADFKQDAFSALNTAEFRDGVVVFVPDNKTLEEPIILRFISDARAEQVGCQIRNLIIVGKNAEVKVAEAYRTLGDEPVFVNTVTEVIVGEDARVDFYKVQDESDTTYHIGTTQVFQENRSYFYAATVSVNGGFIRNNLNIRIQGEHCETFMYGLYVPNEKQHIDNHTLVDHAMPNSVSTELYKGILRDKATGVFNGKIFVREDAQKTNAYQNCRNVMLSDDATMNTKPQLEIWADDVKCSHGTTTGKMNEEALFYMQSRGIPKQEAQRLLMLAFAQDVVEQIKISSIRNYLEARILDKLR